MLALAFLLPIGCALAAEGLHVHFDKGPIHVAMAFAMRVESLNLLKERARDCARR